MTDTRTACFESLVTTTVKRCADAVPLSGCRSILVRDPLEIYIAWTIQHPFTTPCVESTAIPALLPIKVLVDEAPTESQQKEVQPSKRGALPVSVAHEFRFPTGISQHSL